MRLRESCLKRDIEQKESAGRLIPFYNMMRSRKSIHRLWILFVDIRFCKQNRNSAQDLRSVRCVFQHYHPLGKYRRPRRTIRNVERQTRPFSKGKEI